MAKKKSGTTQRKEGEASIMYRMGRCMATTVVVLLLLDAAFVYLVRTVVTVHSCTPYAGEGQLKAMQDVYNGLASYSEAQVAFLEQRHPEMGVSTGHERTMRKLGALGDVFTQLFRGELHLSPPFYDSSELAGKNILVVGGSYIGEFFSHARVLGATLYLMDDPSVAHKASGKLGSKFIPIPEFQRVSIQEPDDIVVQLVEYARLNKIKFDGVLTLVEDESPLAARLAQALNLPGHSPQAADNARSKTKVRSLMHAANLPAPKFWTINNATHFEEMRSMFESAEYPLFLKPVWGVAAAHASKVHSYAELQAAFETAQALIDPAEHSIFHYGSQMVVEEVLSGRELQLELMLLNGELVFHCFSSEYAEDRTFLVFPPRLTEAQKKVTLDLAYNTARAIGLTTGIVHLELFWSPRGTTEGLDGSPQIIEINNRLSRGFLPQSFWHQLAFGHTHTDYFASAIFLSLGLKPPVFERARPPLSLAVFLDEPSANGWETYSECAVIFDSDPISAVNRGLRLRALPAN